MGCKAAKSTFRELFLCKKRIDRALQHALRLPLNACSRYVIISDCHRGEGTMNDNFLKNQNLYFAALENCEGGRDICMIHGHQADFLNSVCWRFLRFLVRYLWKPLEHFGVNDPTSAARNYRKTVRYERCMENWLKNHDVYLVAGHSHRPRIPIGEEKESSYLNAGSCVHPSCITAIELENMQMTLVKWRLATRQDMSLYVMREVMAGPTDIE